MSKSGSSQLMEPDAAWGFWAACCFAYSDLACLINLSSRFHLAKRSCSWTSDAKLYLCTAPYTIPAPNNEYLKTLNVDMVVGLEEFFVPLAKQRASPAEHHGAGRVDDQDSGTPAQCTRLPHRLRAKDAAMRHQRFWLCGFIVLLAMSVSILAKRGTSLRGGAWNTAFRLGRSASRRSFLFSSSSGSSQAPKGTKAAGGASASESAVAAWQNYDNPVSHYSHYDITVGFQPKSREDTNKFARNQRKSSPASQLPSGEDNLFVSKEIEGGFVTLGVADGVGGWAEAGYDSSAISRELCLFIKQGFELATASELRSLSPRELLKSAFEQVTSSPKVEIGGTTACVGILSPDRLLKVANLGDSWCGVFRKEKLVHETSFQTHNFNTPFQLAKIPRPIVRKAEVEGRRYIIDTPDMADEYSWQLERNDIIMFATDGVTDNVVPQDIEVFLQDNISAKLTPEEMGKATTKFVQEVVKVSKDPNFPSAFAQELSRLTGQKYLGGKEDDITVVVARVL